MSTATTAAPRPSVTAVSSIMPGRMVSVDVLRGVTIAGMILVNNPGNWSAVYPPLLHARWHGWTPTDLVFPFFLFVVGVSIVLAYRKRLEGGVDRKHLMAKAGRRSVIIFLLGLFLAAFPFTDFSLSTLRIPGVLQRIAVVYLAATAIFLYAPPKGRHAWSVALLLGYWALMMWVPVPGHGAGAIDVPAGTLEAYLDRLILGGPHLYSGAEHLWDPEGVLSTLPAIVTALLGVWSGCLLTGDRDETEKTAVLLLRGITLVAVGYVWNWFFPINKGIWTSSYVVFTAGLAMCTLGGIYWMVDVRNRRRWAYPFILFGMNAIALYVLSGVLGDVLGLISVGDTSLRGALYGGVFENLLSPMNASLAWALFYVVVHLAVAWILYTRRIFIKV